MADKSAIEWTDATWNPVVGCSIVSPGCTNCYAMKMAGRIQKMNRTGGSNSNYVNHYDGTTQASKAGAVWTGKVALAPDKLFFKPLSWKSPRRIFVNSMGDLFHESIPDEWILRVLDVIRQCSYDGGSNIGRIDYGQGEHTFQVLTKRAVRMAAFMPRLRFDNAGVGRMYLADDGKHPLVMNNLWLGVSTERQQEADERIPLLLDTPAAVRFISAEPLLGPIDLTRLCLLLQKPGSVRAGIHVDALRNKHCESQVKRGLGPLDWVIVGGESGPGARPMHPDWARSLRDQCAEADVPFFFKQWGEWEPVWERRNDPDDRKVPAEESAKLRVVNLAGGFGFHGEAVVKMSRVGKLKSGRLLDGKEHNGFPQAKEAASS